MPVGQLIKPAYAIANDLRTRLIAEWNAPAHESDAQPVVIEDAKMPGRFGGFPPVHLYVIWDEWESLPQRERSEIIMDAYAASHETDDVHKVTVAMGLTAAEARKMGIQYNIVQGAIH